MKVGDLIEHKWSAKGVVGPQKTDMGLGVVLAVHESQPMKLYGTEFELGETATVKLASGDVKQFHKSDFRVIA